MPKIVYLIGRPLKGSIGGRERIILRELEILDKKGFQVFPIFVSNSAKIEAGAECLNRPRFSEVFKNILLGMSLQSSLFFSRKAKERLEKRIGEIQPDLLIVDMVRLANYCKDSPIPKILDVDDFLSVRYAMALKSTELINPFGQILAELPGILKKLLSSKFVQRAILHIETKRLRREELKLCNAYTNCICVSTEEKNAFSALIPASNITTVPNVVESLFENIPLSLKRNANRVLFVGNFAVSHNAATVKRILLEIWPKVPKQLELVLVGPHSNEIDAAWYSNMPNIHVLGTVDDIVNEYATSSILLAPFPFGSGVKTKILEAMACGCLVLTNRMGNSGIEASSKEIFEFEKDEDFANFLNSYIFAQQSDFVLYRENAVAFVKKNFSKKVAEDAFLSVVSNSLQNKQGIV